MFLAAKARIVLTEDSCDGWHQPSIQTITCGIISLSGVKCSPLAGGLLTSSTPPPTFASLREAPALQHGRVACQTVYFHPRLTSYERLSLAGSQQEEILICSSHLLYEALSWPFFNFLFLAFPSFPLLVSFVA